MPPQLLDAYRATESWVEEADPPFALRIGVRSAELAGLHAECGVACSAFLTVYNPGSEPRTESCNRAAQERLEAELHRLGYGTRRGVGTDPAGAWPGETSVLAIGMPADAAESTGRAFGQNAALWSGADAVPVLLVLASTG